jgi:pimeloyl-ACP methyl ester carboxylesterase
MPEPTTHMLDVPGAVLTYDVHRPELRARQPPLFVFGSPMAASGFAELAGQLDDRTVITYDPRGADRSRLAADTPVTAEAHADDLHRVIGATGLAPVDAFGSSGGGAFALAWIVDHPDDVRTLVAHEPPLVTLLEDRDVALRVQADIIDTYRRDGFGQAMAKFIRLVVHAGPLPADFLDQPAPEPAMFGLPAEDDGSRDDPLLSRNLAMPPFEPDITALGLSTVRIVPAVSAQAEGTLAWRGGAALAAALGVDPVVFPGDHAGFATSQWSPANDPAAFAARLREVLTRG